MTARLTRRALVVAAACGPAAAAAAGWTLSYEEDFEAQGALNTGFWTTETGFLRNREAQSYAPANVFVHDGRLVFEARREPAAGKVRYTSGSIVSRGTLHFGRIEVVARSPSGAGLWPAIWLVHESPGQYGEIDIFEAVGKHPDTAFAAVHWGREPRSRQHRNGSRHVPGLEGSWRTHSLEWTAERIVIGLDGQPLFTFNPADAATGGTHPLRQPMRLHINLALGGNWGGPIDDSKLPARFEVRSIRMWRRDTPPVVIPRWGR